MRALMTGFAALALVGCWRIPQHYAVRCPDGRMGVYLKCYEALDCLQEAGRQCPTGYDTFDKGAGEETTVATPVGSTVFAQSRHSTEMLIACRRPESE